MLTIEEITEATAGEVLQLGGRTFSGISIDSRRLREDELFLALEGRRHDGHDFVSEAIKRCKGAVVSRDVKVVPGKSIIKVGDTLKALQDIAAYKRKRNNPIVIGITGSNGKTTTKDMTAYILSYNFKVLKNEGNLNNHIGLPLTLTRLQDEQIAVLEMGASQEGDIRELCEIARPDVGVITNIGQAHLEGFGTLEGVFRTKCEILSFVNSFVLNIDDHYLRTLLGSPLLKTKKVLTYGLSENADVRAEILRLGCEGTSLRLVINSNERSPFDVFLPVPGIGNVYNFLSAIALYSLFSPVTEDIVSLIRDFKGPTMRCEIHYREGYTLISDYYNANPSSMREALELLRRVARGRKVAVLGDMLELGRFSEQAHRELGELLSRMAVDIFIAVGEQMRFAYEAFRSIQNGGTAFHCMSTDEAREILRRVFRKEDTIIIKGSRAMSMERVLEG